MKAPNTAKRTSLTVGLLHRLYHEWVSFCQGTLQPGAVDTFIDGTCRTWRMLAVQSRRGRECRFPRQHREVVMYHKESRMETNATEVERTMWRECDEAGEMATKVVEMTLKRGRI